MASFKQVFCDSRGRDVCILEGPAVFLQAKVKRPPSLPDVSARALSTRDAVDYSLPPGRWDWVLNFCPRLFCSLYSPVPHVTIPIYTHPLVSVIIH